MRLIDRDFGDGLALEKESDVPEQKQQVSTLNWANISEF
jgi:hypothetical protein